MRYQQFSDYNCFEYKNCRSQRKIPDHAKYITTQEFNKITTKNFNVSLKQTNLVRINDFDNKLISFNRKITSNKTKYLEVLKN